jgi:hypothetical protein
VGLEEFAVVRQQFEPLISWSSEATAGVIETSPAAAMLHSFYTEIEKILKLIAREWDSHLPSSDSWHKDLLLQMSQATAKRPAVLSTGLVEVLSEFLAFRHLFRGASIALMRWDKLYPLVAKVDVTYTRARNELERSPLLLSNRPEQPETARDVPPAEAALPHCIEAAIVATHPPHDPLGPSAIG